MTTTTYRANAYTPHELNRAAQIGFLADKLLGVVLVNFHEMTHEEYIDWVNVWKQFYQNVSNYIASQKQNTVIGEYHPRREQSDRMSLAATLRRFANTLLNAREYGQNVRREVRKQEWEVKA
ncbi:hypothetical protein PP939_gp136 [Rhizobium phage RL38J1]|uniref:Uncharacterized protein n=1 Tax=Rhizobium phage RL38J1 TaxID=2663232 RepID=A0A6B9J324_9CAUD|nr:hypothetical protein PP939_gp136 [Rhizobium phage RL38J1]QGZ13962.1 hypothetical protein RL38J1_136 [Rhizobium phage RL38J1]